jgi:RNA polymerase sigma-70 factor (ECF subfamily)
MTKDEAYGEFVRLYTRFEPDLRAFVRSLLPTWTDADEVLQQTALVLWKKFEQFEPDSEDPRAFVRWGCVVARFEAMSYKRSMARDRLVFCDELFELMAEECLEETDQRRREHEALELCLATLPDKQSRLLRLAYTPGVKTKDLAAEAGSSAASFYMKLNRLRKKLLGCVRTRMAAEPMPA